MSKILETAELRRLVPSAFARQPWEGMSSRYRQIPTCEVVQILRERGYFPVKAAQSLSRIEGKGNFTKHLIRFRHAGHLNMAMEPGKEIPELVLYNSHDGSSAYRFAAGIFRVVCSNGLCVASHDFGSVSVKHTGGRDFENRVIDATYRIASDMPKVVEQIEEWKQIALPAPAQRLYAEAVHTMLDNPNITPDNLLIAKRIEDRPAEDGSRSLWTTFNTVQESVIKGGIRGKTPDGRRTTTRPVKSVERDLKLNKALWIIASKMREAMR